MERTEKTCRTGYKQSLKAAEIVQQVCEGGDWDWLCQSTGPKEISALYFKVHLSFKGRMLLSSKCLILFLSLLSEAAQITDMIFNIQ